MIIFSCTKKVRDKLKKHKEIQQTSLETGMANWYVDLIRIHRKEYYLFTNSISLYSIIFYVGTEKEKKSIESIFKTKLIEAIREDFGELSTSWASIFNDESQFTYTKTNSRKVLGSMNDYKWQIEVQVHYNNISENDMDKVRQTLNECPMSLIKYSSGRKEMEKILRQVE